MSGDYSLLFGQRFGTTIQLAKALSSDVCSALIQHKFNPQYLDIVYFTHEKHYR